MVLGDSDELQVGEFVVAQGAPFGLQGSMSVGIISGLNRRVGLSAYEDYIVTDPGGQILHEADLGERQPASAQGLGREGHELAKNMAPAAFSGYIRGAFAEELAQIDADAALELIEPLTDHQKITG